MDGVWSEGLRLSGIMLFVFCMLSISLVWFVSAWLKYVWSDGLVDFVALSSGLSDSGEHYHSTFRTGNGI